MTTEASTVAVGPSAREGTRMFATWLLLVLSGGLLAGDGPATGTGTPSPDEELLKKAGLKTDSPSLLEFFRKRTLPEESRPAVLKFVKQLGSDVYAEREQAGQELIALGPAVGEVLR